MKQYVRAAVPIPKLKEQFAPDMDDTTFQQLIELDPSADYEKNRGGKYCPWIFRQYNKGNLPEEQYTNLKDALGFFLQNYKKYPKNDLGQYKTVDDFLTDTEAVGNRELTDKEKAKLLKKQAHHASDQDKKFLVEDGTWEVWTPLTYPGSVSLARVGGTKATWCTAYEGDDYYYRSYTRRGPLYIFINTADYGEKYQLHFESNSWYDINDSSRGMDNFYKFCDEHPAIKEYFDIKTVNGMNYRADTFVGFADDAKNINIPTDFNVNDLRYNHRLPSGVQTIYFPDGPTNIPENVFANLEHLTTVRLPETLEIIPEQAFKNCTSLKELYVPDSVKKYDNRAFQGCFNLENIQHSANLKVVGDQCFSECSSLKTQLPDSVKYIGSDVFYNCDDLYAEGVKIPSSVDKIPSECFRNSPITSVDLNGVAKIGAAAFRGSKIADIDLKGVTNIGAGAFRTCNNITAIEFNPEGVNVGSHAFADSDISGIVFIDNNVDLGLSVFDNCPNLTVQWGKEDEDYEFENIKLLICDEKACPKLMAANKGYVPIETTEGNKYEVQ